MNEDALSPRLFSDDGPNYASASFPEQRPFQESAHDALRRGFKEGHKNQMLMAPTGAGKTYLGLRIAHETLVKGRKAIFVCDRSALINQTSATADGYGLAAHGIVQANHWRRNKDLPFQIASVQTLARRDYWPGADVIIVDEAHTQHKAWTEYVMQTPAAVIGLSATPFSPGLGKLFTNLVNATTMDELTRSGVLVPMRIFSCTRANMDGAATAGGEWTDVAAEERGMAIVGDVVSEWIKFSSDRKTIVFGATIKHCEELCRQFINVGVMAAVFTSETLESEREALLKEYRKRDSMLRVLISVEALAKGFDCLDEETEILTPSGWRGIGEVAKGDQVYGYDRATGLIEACECDASDARPLKAGERMVAIKSQRFDIRTTEGHQFHIKYRDPKRNFDHQGWLTKTGAEMVSRHSAWGLPLSGFAYFPGVPLSDDELRLVAWFMTDGGFNRMGLSICQSKPFKEEIRDLLTRLNLDFRERIKPPNGFPGTKAAIEFEIPKGTHAGSLARNGWVKYQKYLDKNVAPALMAMTREQFRVFWAELLKGDGAKQGEKAGWLWCDRKEQANAYTQLAVLRGFSASYSTQTTKAGKTMYVVSVRDSQWIGTNASALAAKFQFEEARTDELVWCVKNRLSTLIVRRRGKIAVIGNCPDVGCVVDCRPLRKSLSTAIQMWGRGLRSSPDTGKADCHLLDHSGNIIRFLEDYEAIFYNGLDALDMGEKLDKKIRRDEEKDEAKGCPSCGYKPFAKRCMACGFERQSAALIEHEPGEMREVMMGKKKLADDRRHLWEQVCSYARAHSAPERQSGRAWHLYQKIIGSPPPKTWRFDDTPNAVITRNVRNKILSLNMAYVKAKGVAA